MDTAIPSSSAVRARLERLTWPQVKALCAAVGAPTSTVWKVRTGETTNPGIETIRLIWPRLLELVPGESELIGADGSAHLPSQKPTQIQENSHAA